VSSAITIPLALLASYLLGSVSFGILVATSRGVDIRAEGSGNPGASNIMRVLGSRAAVAVLVGDGLKGAAAAGIGVAVGGPELGYVTLLFGVVGHTFPVWHGLKGGKSVATALGGITYLAPAVGLALGLVWIVIVLVWRTASIASITVMALLVPALLLADRTGIELLWALAIVVFVLVRHASNIKRLFTSSEQKVMR
jgi:glycerol-3-phosphate acyltransferase PlsY